MEQANRYYWLKLKRDFFKRHDIRIIESMPNGKDYILFYLKLLCESVDHEGNLRFSDLIPYNEDMLATITDTNVDIVRSALKVFAGLNMVEVLDDGTYFMREVQRMIGSAADNDNANRQRRYRESKKEVALQNVTGCVTNNNESKSKSKSKSIELEKERIIGSEFPNLERIMTASGLSDSVKEALREFIKMRKQYKKPLSDNALKLLIGKLTKLSTDEQTQVEIVNQSIESGWLSVYPLKRNGVRQGANGIKLSNEQDHTLDGIL